MPSIRAIAELQDIAEEAAGIEAGRTEDDRRRRKTGVRSQLAGQAQKGAAIIAQTGQVERLRGFEAAEDQWKIALEDISARMSGASQAIWTAIRQLHGGVLRTPYGVLVCSKTLVTEVFDNSARRYTVTGYAERMRKSFGEIYPRHGR